MNSLYFDVFRNKENRLKYLTDLIGDKMFLLYCSVIYRGQDYKYMPDGLANIWSLAREALLNPTKFNGQHSTPPGLFF